MRASLITLLLGGALVGLQIGAESRAVATVATYGCQEAHCSGSVFPDRSLESRGAPRVGSGAPKSRPEDGDDVPGAEPGSSGPRIGSDGSDASDSGGARIGSSPAAPEPIPYIIASQDYVKVGVKATDFLKAAISQKKSDVEKQAWTELYDEKDPVMRAADAGNFAGLFTKIGLDPAQQYKQLAMYRRSVNPPETRHIKIVNQCSYRPAAKTIIVDSSFRRNDDPKADADRLTWSELTFQRWTELAGDSTKDLKYVIRQHIGNQETQTTMKTAHNNLKIALDTKGEFYPSAPNSNMDNAFRALAGTDNAKGVFYMLADHHNAFNDLQVVKIHTWPIATRESWPAMVLELGRTE